MQMRPTSLLVEDDSYEGVSAVVVLLTADDRVIDRQSTTVGECEHRHGHGCH